MIEPLRSAQIYVDALCDIFGESINAIVSKATQDIECDPNDLAATIGAFLGIYENGRVPRRYKCIDFVKAFNIEENFDENYVYGKPTLKARTFRESRLVPTFEDLLGEAQQALHKLIAKQLEDPYNALEIFSDNRFKDPRLERFEVVFYDDIVYVKLCYKVPEINEYLLRTKHGAINSGVVASAISLLKGRKGAKFKEVVKEDDCVKIVFEVL